MMVKTKTSDKLPARRPKRPKLKIMAGVLIVIFGVVLWWYHYNQQPAVGTINDVSPDAPKVAAAETSTKTYAGQYVHFMYPGGYSDAQAGSTTSIMTESATFTVHDDKGSRHIALSVRQLQAGDTLEDDSGFRLRMSKPAEYSRANATVAGRQAYVFRSSDGVEITYYIRGAGVYATLSGTTSNPTGGQLEQDMQLAVRDFTWQK